MASSGRNILIAVDYTDESVRTVKWAMGQHVRQGDSVTILNVRPEHAPACHTLPGPGPFAALWEQEQQQREARDRNERRVQGRIQTWASHFLPEGVHLNVETALVSPGAAALAGDVAARDCILKEAKERRADCLILGSHRAHSSNPTAPGSPRSMAGMGLRSLFLGSSMPTSEYCAQHAPCPVIVVPPASPLELPCSLEAAPGPVLPASAFLDSLAL